MGKYGTNLEGFGGFEGGVNSEDGAPLVSTSSDGETSLLFGPAALREIQSNVANGDFAIPPDESTATITSENPLPYWTITETGVSGAVTAAVTGSTNTASGAALTFSVAAAAATGSSCTITRYVPIAGNANRSSAYHPEVYVATVSGGLTDKGRVRLTLTATAVDANYSALTVTATANDTASGLPVGSLFTDWIVPDKTAAYILVSVKVDVPATAPAAAVTFVIGEVRVARSESAIAFPATQSASTQPWLIQNDNGTFEIFRQNGASINQIQMSSDAASGVYDITLWSNDVNGTVTLIAGGVASISAPIVDIGGNTAITGTLDVDSDITAIQFNSTRLAADNDVFLAQVTGDSVNRFLIEADGGMFWGSGAAARDVNLYRAGANVLRTDDELQVGAGSIGSNGTFTGLNAILSGGNGLRHDTPATTTQTSSAGIWVLVSGTQYQLRRNSSSARYKTNIVDADEVVLEAARKVKPRHYESTIDDEAGATRLGFIAEEIHEAGLTHAVGYDAEGKPETIDPTALIAALWHRVSDLEDRLKALEES